MARRYRRNLSHSRLFTGNMGELIPVCVLEVLPGDTFRHRNRMLIRLSTLHRPLMHQVRVSLHSFYVPYRLLWDEFEDFITGVPDNAQQTRTVPTVTADGGRLCDYMGVPPEFTSAVTAYPFYAYRKIYNDWYRDQQLQTELVENDGSVDLLKRNWEKDYFTTARPQPQLGPEITIPIAGGGAAIEGIGHGQTPAYTSNVAYRQTGGDAGTWPSAFSTQAIFREDANNPGYPDVRLAASAGIDLDDLRRGMALKRIAETRNRYGSRYVEMLRSWGVRASDGRLQNAELCSMANGQIAFSEVLDTAGTAPGAFVGEQAGHGISAVQTRPYRKTFEEHGVLMTLFSMMPRTSYVQGLDRMHFRKDRDDYFHPELMGIGDQQVMTRELWASAAEDQVFGWQSRYREYRDRASTVHDQFRSGEEENWHMARSFSTEPVLNDSFVTSQPTNRIYADASQPQFRVNISNDISARRLV